MLRHGNTWIGLGFIFSFWLFAPFIERGELFNIVNGLAVSIGLGLLVGWLPGILAVIRENWHHWTSGYYLISGVWVIGLSLAIYLSSRIYWRATGDRSILDALWVAWAVWGMAGGLVLCMTATGVVEGRIPPRNWILAGRWVALGLALAALLHATGWVTTR